MPWQLCGSLVIQRGWKRILEAQPSSGTWGRAVSEAGSGEPGFWNAMRPSCNDSKLLRWSQTSRGLGHTVRGLGAAVRLREKCDIMSQICLEPMRGEETPPCRAHITHAPLQCLREKPRNPAFRLNLRHGARTASLPSAGRMRQR